MFRVMFHIFLYNPFKKGTNDTDITDFPTERSKKMPTTIRKDPSSKLNGSDTQSNTADKKNQIADLIKNIESSPRVTGRKEYIRFLQGKKITRNEAIAAHCYECMGHYVDGREDCTIGTCSLYPFSPSKLYGALRPLKKQKVTQEDQ